MKSFLGMLHSKNGMLRSNVKNASHRSVELHRLGRYLSSMADERNSALSGSSPCLGDTSVSRRRIRLSLPLARQSHRQPRRVVQQPVQRMFTLVLTNLYPVSPSHILRPENYEPITSSHSLALRFSTMTFLCPRPPCRPLSWGCPPQISTSLPFTLPNPSSPSPHRTFHGPSLSLRRTDDTSPSQTCSTHSTVRSAPG